MSFSDTLTLTKADGTTTENFDQISTAGLKTTRAVAGRDLDKPKEIIISHEQNKDKSRTSSVVYIDRTEEDATPAVPVLGTARVQLKISYSNGVITASQIKDDTAQLIDFVNGSGNIDKLLNREH